MKKKRKEKWGFAKLKIDNGKKINAKKVRKDQCEKKLKEKNGVLQPRKR